MNFGSFDLNLLVVFDALMQERNVTRAGARIGLSQPAVSHALNRLRYMLKDDLFVRTPQGMVPTSRAQSLAEPLRQALSTIRIAIEPASFDAKTAERVFVIAANNYAVATFVPSLVTAVAARAPAVRLDLRPTGTTNVFDQLDRGDIDLAICGAAEIGERFVCTSLLADQFVLVMRRGHRTARGQLSPEAFAGLPHLEISSSHEGTGSIDEWLEQRSLSRRVALRAPYISAGRIIAETDMVAILSRGMARALMESHALQLRNLPFEVPPIGIDMLWHRRLDGQAAHRWLRSMIAAAARHIRR